MGTDEQAVYDAIDETGSADNWAQVVRLYPEVYDDIYGDFSGTDLELVKSKLQNIGVTMPEEGQQDSGNVPDESDPNQDAGGNDIDDQRADRNAANELKTAKEVWDEIKAMRDAQPQGPERVRLSNLMNQINVSPTSGTSPEDAAEILAQAKNGGEEGSATATPTDGAEQPGDVAAQAGEPTNDLEQRVARYEAMPLETEDQIRAYMQALKDDEEVFNLLPQGDRDAINTYLGS